MKAHPCIFLFTLVLVAFSFVPLCLAYPGRLVGVSWSGDVYRIHEQTGLATLANDAVLENMNSLAMNSVGELYTTAGNKLAKIEPITGSILNSITLSLSDFRAAAFSPSDQLFVIRAVTLPPNPPTPPVVYSQLMTIDTQTGNLASIAEFDLGISGMAFSSDGTLYAWDVGPNAVNGLGLITFATDGSGFTDVNALMGTPGSLIQSLEFSPDGTLYGARDRLFTIDVTTGAWTAVGSQNFDWDVRGLAYYVPEPACYALSSSALAALWFRKRNTKRAFVSANR